MIPIDVAKELATRLGLPAPSENVEWYREGVAAGFGAESTPCYCGRGTADGLEAVRLRPINVDRSLGKAKRGHCPPRRVYGFRVGRCARCGTVYCFYYQPITKAGEKL